MDEETLKAKLLETLMPFGVRRLVNATGTRNNKNQKTKSLFPHRYVTWVCGTCDKDVVQKSDEEFLWHLDLQTSQNPCLTFDDEERLY